MKKWYGACFFKLGTDLEEVHLFTDTTDPKDIWDRAGWESDRKLEEQYDISQYIYVEIEIDEE